jgi:hypothetical protein
MTRGRKPNVARLVQRWQGTAEAKARLTAILATLSGKQTVAQACSLLGVGERGFYKLRDRFLQAALLCFEPRGPGRPPVLNSDSAAARRVTELEAALRDVRVDLRAARIREEIAMALPHLLRRSVRAKKSVRHQRHR